MQTSTWVTMAVVLAIVWGGFLYLLSKAMRAESRKQGD